MPRLGDRVRVGAVMKKRFGDSPPVRWVSRPLKAEVVGVFAGWRWRQNGRVEWGYSDEPGYFVEMAPRTRVALVYVHEWKEPLVADPASLTPVSC